MSAACPKCGVAVVPGYVKCPKCHAPLPATSRFKSTTVDPGGTSMPEEEEPRGFPIAGWLAGVVVAGAIVAFFALRGDKKPAVHAETPAPAAPGAITTPTATGASPVTPIAATPGVAAAAVDPTVTATQLQHALQKQRMWSTVDVVGKHVDVRSRSCADASMAPLLDAAAPAFHAAGITKLRCVDPSGAVVFEREL